MSTSQEQSSPAPSSTRPKKVRIACKRCRDRRIKCDGQVPACSKCAKAGVSCIDLDSRSGERHVPRSLQADGAARLEWLEGLVRDRLPDVDLSGGPANLPQEAQDISGLDLPGSGLADQRHPAIPGDASNKRSRPLVSDAETEAATRRKARRMALDLGLLSLDINASQVQYLGSSSGSFFPSLLQGREGNVYNEQQDASQDALDGVSVDGGRTEQEHDANRSRDLFKTLGDTLPQRRICDTLVEHFFAHYHPDYPVLHRPSFDSLVDGLYACAANPSAEVVRHNGWASSVAPFTYNGERSRSASTAAIAIPVQTAAAQLLFVLSTAAHLQTRQRSFIVDPSKLHKHALHLAQKAFQDVSLSSLQVLILHLLQGFLAPQAGNAWIMLHAAMAYAVELGLHRDVPTSRRFPPLALQMRRRIFFCTYTLDRIISTAQGRPLGFQDDTLDLSLPLPFVPEPDVSEQRKSDQVWLPYSVLKFQWATILSRIKYQLYRFQEPVVRPALTAVLDQLSNDIETWLANGTQIIEGFPAGYQTRLRTKLKIDYHFIRCLLYQPSQACMTPDDAALLLCFESATERIRLYDSLYDQNNLYVSWPTTHGIFLAGATLVYCIWMSPEVRSKVTLLALTKDFRLCSNLLTLGGEWWPLAQRGRRSFDRLADSTLESLTNHQTAQSQRLPDESEMARATASALENDPFAGLNFQSPSTNVEGILQTFLQNELPFPDMLDTFEATGFGQEGYPWDSNHLFNFEANYQYPMPQ